MDTDPPDVKVVDEVGQIAVNVVTSGLTATVVRVGKVNGGSTNVHGGMHAIVGSASSQIEGWIVKTVGDSGTLDGLGDEDVDVVSWPSEVTAGN